MSRPSLRVLIWLLAACSARTSELLAMVVMMLVGVADSRLARQLLMSSPRPVGMMIHVRLRASVLECGCPLPLLIPLLLVIGPYDFAAASRLQHLYECLLRNVHGTKRFHPFLALLLFFQKFAF